MTSYRPADAEIRALLTSTKRIAVVGFSDDEGRPSHTIARYLAANGYVVTGVNPTLAGRGVVAGIPVVASLADARPLDLVDVFRRPDQVMPIVEDAIAAGAKAVWLQDGVVHEAAAARAAAAGLIVVMDDCTYRQHRRMGLGRA